MKPLVSVCIPAYDEGDVVDQLARRLGAMADGLAAQYDFEFVICENGSRDDTYAKLLRARERDARLKIVRLSRNFYAEGGVTAALAHARGDCAVIMNADLQDPPEYVPQLLARWREGYDNVYCIVARRPGESRFRRLLARAYYALMNAVSEVPAPRDVSDFRLVDRELYTLFLRMPERFRIMRFMWAWMGFRSTGVATVRPARAGGSSKFRFFQTLSDALRHVFAQSRSPLVIMPGVALASAVLAFTLLAVSIVRAVAYGVPFVGFEAIVALLLLLFGLVFAFLWLIGEYVGMIFEQKRGRPLFVIAAAHGLDVRDDGDEDAERA